MSRAEEVQLLKVMRGMAIGPSRKYSIEQVGLEVFDGAEGEEVKLGRRLYAQLDPSEDKRNARFPVEKLPVFIRATGRTDIIHHLAEQAGGVFYKVPPAEVDVSVADLNRKAPETVHHAANVVSTIMEAQSPDSPGGLDFVQSEKDMSLRVVDDALRVLLEVRAILQAIKVTA